MPATKRARPDFEPPRPKKKDTGKASKPRNSEQSKKKRGRPSKESTSKATRRRSEGESNAESASDISDEQDADQSNTEAADSDGGSEEPDYILAEVTTEPTGTQDHTLSLPLIHRIMQEHFKDGEKMKVSVDARELVGKYIEVFVREAIMRSAYERNERDKEDGGGGTSSGWLEVEDLERIAPQLCLDF